ncbi:hypothetical protein FACS1894133_7710 [Clostridia bacterium]|nr:hypothetical protein FACS1894133_7710 [Clostridia bacterium]
MDTDGMTDRQFVSYRCEQLSNFARMLTIAKKTNADDELLEIIREEIEKAKADIEF